MRRTFFIQAGETQKDYFTRAAKLQASIKNGEAIDGVAVTEQEAKEFIDYVFEKMYPIVNRVVECEARAAKLNSQVAEIFRSNVYHMVINEFHRFNNYDTDSEKEFTLECFIKSRVNGCIRDAIAEDKGLGINRSRILHNIMKAKAKIAAEKGITEDEVRVEDIHNRLKGSISKKLVMELLELERGTVSIAEMDENGEQIGDGKSGIVTYFDNEMDYDTRKILDETFEQFSNLDIYILMKEFGLFGEEIRKQEMCDFVITTEFQKLLAEDMTIRSKSDPIKTAYNKKIKIKKVLASLAGKINMAELEGTLEAYVEEKWKSIVG